MSEVLPAAGREVKSNDHMGPIDAMNMNALDLDLMRVLDALLYERSGTRAGKRTCLSPQAGSRIPSTIEVCGLDRAWSNLKLAGKPPGNYQDRRRYLRPNSLSISASFSSI